VRAKFEKYEPLLTISYFSDGVFDPIAVTAGIIQTAIYADFGYIVS
jgi:ER lumen protein retaining receptor